MWFYTGLCQVETWMKNFSSLKSRIQKRTFTRLTSSRNSKRELGLMEKIKHEKTCWNRLRINRNGRKSKMIIHIYFRCSTLGSVLRPTSVLLSTVTGQSLRIHNSPPIRNHFSDKRRFPLLLLPAIRTRILLPCTRPIDRHVLHSRGDRL